MSKHAAKRGRPTLSAVSFASLQAELARRTAKAGGMLRKRDRLLAQLATVEAKLSKAGIDAAPSRSGLRAVLSAKSGGGRASPRKRPRNAMNLVDSLKKLLDGRTMSVTDAAEAVQRAGYKSSSKTFRTIVNQTLLKANHFKKVDRGQYTTKK